MATTRVQQLLERLGIIEHEALDLRDVLSAWGLDKHAAGTLVMGNLGTIQAVAGVTKTLVEAEQAKFPIEAVLAPRVGPFRVMHSGIRFWMLDPRAEEITPEDIAWHLSMLVRFNGSPSRFYGVAEHTLLVANIAERRYAVMACGGFVGAAAVIRPYALLHEAAETYVGDIHRGLRKAMRGWEPMEARILAAAYAAFGLPIISAEMADALEWADDVALILEAQALHQPFDADAWAGGLPQVVVGDADLDGVALDLGFADDPIAGPREALLAELQEMKRAAEAREVEVAKAAAERGTYPEPVGGSWRDELAVTITPVEWCKVCEMDGKKAKAVENGLCNDCVPF